VGVRAVAKRKYQRRDWRYRIYGNALS